MNLSDEAIAALARLIGIDAQEITRRKAFLEFDETDVSLLAGVHARLQDASRHFVDDFYALLIQFEETRHFISDPHILERLKQTQAAYFDSLIAGDYGPEYVLQRLRVGVVHQRIGLEPKWYLGAYSKYLAGLLPELWRLLGDDPNKFLATYHALQKIVFLDMGLAIDTYIQADRRTILGLKRYAENIIASLPAGLIVVDNAFKVRSVNRSFREMFGLKNGEDVSGRELEDILPLPDLHQQTQAVLAGRMTLRGIDVALGEKWLRLTITGIRLAEEEEEEEEEEERLLVVVEDVSEEHRLRAEARTHEEHYQDLVQGLDAIVWEADAATFAFTFVSRRAEAILGYPVERWLTEPDFWASLIYPEDREQAVAFCRAATAQGSGHAFDYRAVAADGRVVWLHDIVRVVRDEMGRVRQLRGIMVDITERKQAEEWRQHYTRTLDSLATGAPLREVLEGIAVFIERQSEGALCSILLLLPDGKRLMHGAAPSLPEFYNRAIDGLEIGEGIGSCGTVAATGRTVIAEDVLTHPYWADYRELAARAGVRACWSEPVLSADNKVLGTFALYHREPCAPTPEEMALIRQAARLAAIAIERARQQEDLRLAAVVFEQSAESVIITDAKERILAVNRAFTQTTGYAPEEVIGQTPRILQSERQNAAFYRAMWESIRETGQWQGEIWNRRKSGEIHPVWKSISAVRNGQGEVTHYIGIAIDISEHKAQAARIEQLAFYDPLTGLPNRSLLRDRVQRVLTYSTRHKNHGAILFIDLDNFKALNDTKGHNIGDLLLIEVAKRLQACVRSSDTVARTGGDEFVVVLEELNKDTRQAVAQAQNIGEKVLASLNRPYNLQGFEHYNSASIGISLFRDNEIGMDNLFRHADTAMYQAKTSGRNTLRFFDPDMQASLEARATLEADLRHALSQQQFKLFFQIQVNAANRPIGAEALLRWLHPERGLVSPQQFIPLAEDTRLILPIGQWVLETACAQIKVWEANPLVCELQLAVNVSARQFHQPDFVEQVCEALKKTGADPARLKLELTESVVLGNIDSAVAKMHELKGIGVSFSMDDFGTGYSSLSYLTQLPLDQLKIDRSFVHNIGIKPTDAVIVQTIISMGNSLGIEVMAEGVENEEQRDFLERNGCHAYQGYLFSKPVPIEEFEALIRIPN